MRTVTAAPNHDATFDIKGPKQVANYRSCLTCSETFQIQIYHWLAAHSDRYKAFADADLDCGCTGVLHGTFFTSNDPFFFKLRLEKSSRAQLYERSLLGCLWTLHKIGIYRVSIRTHASALTIKVRHMVFQVNAKICKLLRNEWARWTEGQANVMVTENSLHMSAQDRHKNASEMHMTFDLTVRGTSPNLLAKLADMLFEHVQTPMKFNTVCINSTVTLRPLFWEYFTFTLLSRGANVLKADCVSGLGGLFELSDEGSDRENSGKGEIHDGSKAKRYDYLQYLRVHEQELDVSGKLGGV